MRSGSTPPNPPPLRTGQKRERGDAKRPWPRIKRRRRPERNMKSGTSRAGARFGPPPAGPARLGRAPGELMELRKYAALGVGAADALEGDGHRRHPPVAFLRGGVLADRQIGPLHPLGQPLLDLFQVPSLGALVLQPLVVADHHAAGIGEDVGDDVDLPVAEDRVRVGLGGAVGAFDDQLDVEGLRFFDADLQLQRRRDEDIGGRREEFRAGDRAGAGIADHRALLEHVFRELEAVDAVGVGDVPLPVTDRDQRGAGAGQDLGRVRADVAEPLDDEGRAVQVEAPVAGPLRDAVDDPLAGGGLASERSPRGERLAGDHPAVGVLVGEPHDIHVRVHHPDHDLAVGADVGGGDVVLGPDVGAEGVGEAPGDALDLGQRVVARRELDAALSTAEWDVVQRRLVGHPGRQRLHLVEGDLLVVSHAALVGAQNVAVLDAVALEHLVLSAIHADRKVDDELVLGLRQDLPDRRQRPRDQRGVVELLERDRVWVRLRFLLLWHPPKNTSPVSASRLRGYARALALEIAAEARAEWGFASDIIARTFRKHRELASGDRRLCAETIYGLIRMNRRLDAIVEELPGSGALSPLARDELKLLVYEARSGVPTEALAAEAQRVVRGSIDLARAAGDEAGLSGRRGLDREAVRLSYPTWLIEMFVEDYGNAEGLTLADAMNRRAPMAVRVNTLRTTRQALIARLGEEHVVAQPTPLAPAGLLFETRVNAF